jgi:putative membrane protein
MNSKILIGLSASILMLAACGQKNDTAPNTGANVAAENGIASAPSPDSAQGFASTAAASDRFEIESAKLAEKAAQSAAVKNFAAKMITAHQASTSKLKATTAALSPPITPDDTLSAAQQQDLDGLKNRSSSDFDAAYSAMQVKAHQQALDALKAYAASGDTPALKEFANGLIPTVTAHLSHAKELK